MKKTITQLLIFLLILIGYSAKVAAFTGIASGSFAPNATTTNITAITYKAFPGASNPITDESQIVSLTINVTTPGTLDSLVGTSLSTVNDLTVTGTVIVLPIQASVIEPTVVIGPIYTLALLPAVLLQPLSSLTLVIA